MRSWLSKIGVWGIVAWLLAMTSAVQAQAPDIRSVRPVVMLAVDTSGSMERRADCRCRTVACTECLPNCSSSRGYQRNRWALVLEALTGSFRSYTCSSVERTQPFFRDQYDHGYYLPHIELPLQPTNQQNNGILDSYLTRIKFGLMTFDSIGTLTTHPPLVTAATYRARSFTTRASAREGMFSYGEQREFTFRGCDTTYMIDNGARSAGSHGGALISVGGESDYQSINGRIQQSLLRQDSSGRDQLRPYGATPIAGMLDDLRYYLDTNVDVRRVSGGEGDRYHSCRKRYTILLTDGEPNADMRGRPYHCDAAGFRCPYQTPNDIATALCGYSSTTRGCTGALDGLFVVGFDVGGDAVTRLNSLAAAGGTGRAYFANNREELARRLGEVLDATAPGTTSRTVPSFTTLSGSGTGASGQLQFNTGFQTTASADQPWHGVLERRRFTCDGVDVVAQRVTGRDRFHQVLNDRNITSSPRKIYTVLPRDAARLDDHITSSHGETRLRSLGVPLPELGGVRQTGLRLEDLNLRNTNLTTGHLNLTRHGTAAAARRELIIRTLHGYSGTIRRDHRLGDIYHSSPIAHSAPNIDRADSSFNLFRNRPEVATRPTVVYVGTNDGILHAFAAEDAAVTREGGTRISVRGGDELWGFVPPLLLPKLESTLGAHQFMVDATPVVKEVYVGRRAGQAPNAEEWRTVLLSGLRGGGRGFFALDVSDPLEPNFLWQFSNDNVGETYGQPAMGQVLINLNGQDHERAVAILPGGEGRLISGRECPVVEDARPEDATPHRRARRNRRCWESGQGNGRYLAVVDVATGRTIREFGTDVFPAPLSGGISLYAGQTGAVATRAFFTDADGIIWRLNLAGRDPSRWSVRPMHDLYYDLAWNSAQPAYSAPVLSTDDQGNVVVMVGTGNIDRLDDYTARNRVVSFTERVSYDSRGELRAAPYANLNWSINLQAGEQVTGPLELYNGHLYFATFKSTSDPANACAFGISRIYGAHYRNTRSELQPAYGLESRAGTGVYDRLYIGPETSTALNNSIVLGVAVTRRPQCIQGTEATEMDPFMGSRSQFRVQRTAAPSYQLVAITSSGRAPTGGAAGATLGEFSRALPAPRVTTQMSAFAGSID